MSRSIQEWSLEDVLGILFGQEGKFIVKAIRGKNIEGAPESFYKNQIAKRETIDSFARLIEESYDGPLGDPYIPKPYLGVKLDPLIVTRWLRDKNIFEKLYRLGLSQIDIEGKIDGLKESTAKDFRSIDLKIISKADCWRKTEFFIVLFGEAYSDNYFPVQLQEFSSSLNSEIECIENYLIGAIERGELVASTSAVTPTVRGEYLVFDDGYMYNPIQLLSVIQSKNYPVPKELIQYLKENKYDQAVEQLKKLRSNMLQLLKCANSSSDDKTLELDKFIRELSITCDNNIEIKIKKPGKQPFALDAAFLGFRNVRTNQWKTLISVLKSDDHIIYYDNSMQNKKQIFREIQKKLLRGLKKAFVIDFPEDFRLIESIKGEPGNRKFKFQVTSHPEKPGKDYSEFDKEQIQAELKNLAINYDSQNDYLEAYNRAKELGMNDDEIKSIISMESEVHKTAGYGSGYDYPSQGKIT